MNNTFATFKKAFSEFGSFDDDVVSSFIANFNDNLHAAHGENDTLDGEWVLDALETAGVSYDQFAKAAVTQLIAKYDALTEIGIPHQVSEHIPMEY